MKLKLVSRKAEKAEKSEDVRGESGKGEKEAEDSEQNGPSIEHFRKLAEETAKSYEPPEGWLEIDAYPVYDMYVFSSVHIVVKEDENDLAYHVKEPDIDEKMKNVVKELLSKLEYLPVLPEEMKNAEKIEILKSKTDKILSDFRIKLSRDDYCKVFYYVLRETVLYGKITPLMYDPMLEDISCNGYNKPVYVFHRKFANLKTNISFESDELDSFVIKLAQQCGKHISIAEPMVDASMPDGSRIQMTLGREVTDHGSTFTIRKFRKEPITPVHLIKWKTFSSEQMAYLWLCIENRKSLIFAGGTASGKTTSTNAAALFIPKKAKIVTIEDTRELVLPHKNWIPAVTREALQKGAKSIDMYDLLRAALRQRPEYIIVGEVRGREALTLFQAMSTGHTTYSTLHADSVEGVIHRLENPPINVPRPMIEALDIISVQAQTYVGTQRVRRNVEIAEIVGLDPHTKMLRTTTVFKWDSVKDEQIMIGSSKALEEIRLVRGWSRKELEEELERRMYVLEKLAEKDITKFEDVARFIRLYQSNPEKVINELGIEV